ncbi:Ubiquitin carboxyl-terminal hydrolase MINDY-1 [Hondaea fermentalgiana]|uniref:Ubiquitin carboxyl-terminal hydrolase MINDY-1 n=1 Tax=Hondaea fermentalgiana TaxID=2315210 RepID=A0A2R5G609_9STRA|nr:Ubiquitin carboxyl-terminal hydrolase MINDY-1 [Hondaea fermentalgiana]|eukprot:GBG25769.1 Ubiquitin carboxyl-terminal hydrolase MINDY-1 [Hondaea fermentalgiana]
MAEMDAATATTAAATSTTTTTTTTTTGAPGGGGGEGEGEAGKVEDKTGDHGFVHEVKRMAFLNREVSVVLQNENGPCPLIALVNVLLLRGTLKMHKDRRSIGSENLIAMVANLLVEKNGSGADENMQHTMQEMMDILPTLQYGLDVNVRFGGVSLFEFDNHVAIFDLLGVNLFHGWVVDQQDTEVYDAIANLSYNQAMDRIIAAREAGSDGQTSSEELVQTLQEAEIIERFLSETASQFTFTALTQLHETVKEREVCVFFRNNHFSTLFKIEGHLYALVTDQGYRDNGMIGWELLNAVDGDTELVSPSFGQPSEYVHPNDLGQTLEDQGGSRIDADEELARQLAAQERAASRQNQGSPRAQQRAQARNGRPGNPNTGPSKGSGCVVM